jgi:exoribonuclease-2
MKPGTVVTYFDKDRIISAVCLECKENRLHLLSEHSREINLGLSRVIHSTPAPLKSDGSRENLLKALKALLQEAEALKAGINTEDLWNLVQGEAEHLDIQYLAELVFGGNPTPAQAAATLRALYGDKIHFKLNQGAFIIHSAEQARKIETKIRRDAERENDLAEGSDWLRKKWAGTPVDDPAGKSHYVSLLRGFAVFGDEYPEAPMAAEMLKRAQLNQPDMPLKLLIKMGEVGENENILLERHAIPSHWTPEALSESERILESFSETQLPVHPVRRDLRDLAVFSIDSETTRDIDDAVSIELGDEGSRIGIHITDVAEFILPGTQLDREASERTASLYMPEGKIPMLPSPLSEGILSLGEGKPRLAVSIDIRFDASLNLTGFTIFPSVIRVKRRYTYAEANELIHDSREFSCLYGLAQRLREKRVGAGALLLPIPELIITVDGEGSIQISKRERELPSEIIISELMILTNWLCAGFLQRQSIPLIYRNQPEPRETVPGAGQDNLLLNLRQRRLLNRVTLSTAAGNHSSLGLQPYSTFTSPIRKYADLVAQRQLKAALLGESSPYPEAELRKIITDLEINGAKINLVQEQRHRYWLTKHLAGKIGDTLNALVVNQVFNRCDLFLTDYLVETSFPCPPSAAPAPGTTLAVRLEKVDVCNGTIRVTPLQQVLKK